MTLEDYLVAPGLSSSGLDDFAVSPLRYWHLQVNPNRPTVEPTSFMEFGSALHCAVLEPDAFESRYCQKLDPSEIDGCLDTIGDMRGWLLERGVKAKGTRKDEVIDQVLRVDETAPVLAILRQEHDKLHEGKIKFNSKDWFRIGGAAQALRDEPELQTIMSHESGNVERTFIVNYNGVPLKSRMDFVSPDATLDLKTITARRGQSFDKSVTNAIWYEGYHRQAFFYCLVRSIAEGLENPQKAPPFIFAFVESDDPHETRIREFRPTEAGEVNMLWERARVEVTSMIQEYARLYKEFGERPWRYAQRLDPLVSEEFPQVLFGR